jgi:hypothetical protein
MQLQELFDYKNRLMRDILTNEEIVKLINPDCTLDDAPGLVYKQVFPYEYVPVTLHDGATFVCCDVDITRVDNKTFYTPIMYIWVFCHRSQLILPEGGVRPDKLCSEICKQINGSRFYGLGELNLYGVRRFAPITDYQGKRLTFTTKDFNLQYDPLKETPSNRKLD